MNDDAKRPPQCPQDGRNPISSPDCNPAIRRTGCHSGSCCQPIVALLPGYSPRAAEDICDDARHYGEWHRSNDAMWNERADRRHLEFVKGPFPCR
ncbi:MAG: hypothetical protein ACI8TP_004726 [Acidimicrobiales bacterium]|jgi:hypothetical protein